MIDWERIKFSNRAGLSVGTNLGNGRGVGGGAERRRWWRRSSNIDLNPKSRSPSSSSRSRRRRRSHTFTYCFIMHSHKYRHEYSRLVGPAEQPKKIGGLAAWWSSSRSKRAACCPMLSVSFGRSRILFRSSLVARC